MSDLVCPRCGAVAAENEYCSTCGLHLAQQPELPTRERWEARQASALEHPAATGSHEGTDAGKSPLGAGVDEKLSASARAPAGRPAVFWVTAAAALLMIIGGFGTWATATTVFGSLSVAGTSGDGWFLIAGGAVGGGLLLWHVSQPQTWKPILIAAAALLGLVPASIDFSNIHDVTGESNGVLIQIGWGLYISVIASAGLLVTAVYTVVKRPYSDRAPGHRGA